ncbi:MAG: hypothetical protein AB1324_01810 [Candidatus Micrarchaeota archaeon]
MKDENRVVAALAYLFPIVGGALVLLLRKDGYERFHGAQSIFFWVAAIAISLLISIAAALIGIIPFLGRVFGIIFDLISILFGLAVLILWLLLMWKAYKGEGMELPLITAEAKKIGR